MRRVRYSVAASLDAYIAGPNGEFDWIIPDPTIDFSAIFSEFDILLMGRRTFEITMSMEQDGSLPRLRTYVFSRTLRAEDFPDVTIVAHDAASTVAALKAENGKDIWLFGGGELFRHLLEAKLVDSVEVAVVPVLLGQGIPLLPTMAERTRLELANTKTYPSGIVSLSYNVRYETV